MLTPTLPVQSSNRVVLLIPAIHRECTTSTSLCRYLTWTRWLSDPEQHRGRPLSWHHVGPTGHQIFRRQSRRSSFPLSCRIDKFRHEKDSRFSCPESKPFFFRSPRTANFAHLFILTNGTGRRGGKGGTKPKMYPHSHSEG